MPSYLFVLCMGELERTSRTIAGVDVGVVTTRGKKDRGAYALDVVSQVLPYFNDYFGVKYPLPKLDLIATPGGFGGAMENWGGITFFESRLLFDPKKSSQADREDIFTIISHELAHQWFGNLVTMAWWDDLWLNEGFASWMEVKATEQIHPEWSPWLQESLGKVWTLAQDAQPTTHPIQMPVVNASDAESAFDGITYGKGSAVIRMLESYLGPDAFRDGVRGYMRTHAYGNARTADLWRALGTATGQPVERVAADWVARPGFPLVTAGLSGGALALSQTRFTADGTPATDAPWPVPVVYTAGGRPATVLFDKARQEVPLAAADGPVIVNAGATGYYRVRYEADLFDRQRRGFAKLTDADRTTLLSDTWALVEASGATAADYLSLVDQIDLDVHPTVWEHVLNALSQVRRYQQGAPGQAAYERAVQQRLRPLAARLGWRGEPGEPAAVTRLRPKVLSLLGMCGDPGVLAESRRLFAAFQKNPAAIDNDVRPRVMHLIGRYGTPAEFDALLALARASEDVGEQHDYMTAAASTLDPVLAERVLARSIARDLDPTLAVRLVGRVSEQHPELVRTHFQRHAKTYLAGRSPQGQAEAVTRAYQGFSDLEAAAELERYAARTVSPDAMAEIRQAATHIRFEAGLKARLVPAFDAWAEKR
ncbi:Aminopeptidase N [compost metagenome]